MRAKGEFSSFGMLFGNFYEKKVEAPAAVLDMLIAQNLAVPDHRRAHHSINREEFGAKLHAHVREVDAKIAA